VLHSGTRTRRVAAAPDPGVLGRTISMAPILNPRRNG
jgi:hypothetical protein